MRVFAFLDLDHPPVAWAAMRGMLVSADRVPGDDLGFLSFMHAGMLRYQDWTRLHNEQEIERHRPNGAISRVRGMYFFGDREAGTALIGNRDWPPYFTEENLVEFELHHYAVSRVDANWITHAPRLGDGQIDRQQLGWIRQYWESERMPEHEPIWELVATGVAVILDEECRRRAFDIVHAAFPDCFIIGEMARLAGEAGFHGGLIAPYLQQIDVMTYSLDYCFREAEFRDEDCIAGMQQHANFGRLAAHANAVEQFPVPDFGQYSVVLRVEPAPL